MASAKITVTLKRRVQYRPDTAPYYPGKVVTKELIKGYAKKNAISMSEAMDRIINPFFKNMSEAEKEVLRAFAKGQD